MSAKKRVVAALVLWCCAHGAAARQVDEHAQSLCPRDEIVVATCFTKAKPTKLVSICSSAPGASKKTIAYRYGTKKKIEMTYQVDAANPGHKMYRGTYSGANNQTTLFWFTKDEFLYRVAVSLRGVVNLSVVKNEREVLSRDCTSNALGDTEIKHDLLIEKTPDEMFDVWTKGS